MQNINALGLVVLYRKIFYFIIYRTNAGIYAHTHTHMNRYIHRNADAAVA
jgi:hypothetical protein